jgi:MFS family permease
MRKDTFVGGGGSGPPVRTAIVLVALLCAIYSVSQFLRNSVGVIAPDIAREFALSPASLGVLSSVFFFSFAAVQIPLGIAIDRFGPLRCMLASIGLAVSGCLLFAAADSLLTLSAARVLMGIGCSSLFMAPLAIYTRWFPGRWFSTLTGIQLGIGTLGTLLATAPLAYASESVGWRTSFVVVGLATALIGLAVALVARDDPPGADSEIRSPQSLVESVRGLADIVRVPGFVPIFVLQLVAYSSFVSVLGLWGGPFLSDVLGLDLAARGNLLLVMAGFQTLGLLAWGPMDRVFASRTRIVGAGVLSTAAFLFLLGLLGDRGGPVVIVLFAALGFSAAYVVILTAHGRALFRQEQVGRGMTAINMATIGGVFVMQMATGAIVGLFDPLTEGVAGHEVRPFAAYRAAFWFLGATLLAAWLVYRRAPDPRL